MPLIFKNSMQRKVIYGRDGDENGLFHEFRAATRAQDRSLSTRQTAIQQIVLSGVTMGELHYSNEKGDNEDIKQ